MYAFPAGLDVPSVDLLTFPEEVFERKGVESGVLNSIAEAVNNPGVNLTPLPSMDKEVHIPEECFGFLHGRAKVDGPCPDFMAFVVSTENGFDV